MTDEAKALVEQTINVARKIVEEEYLQVMAEMTQRHMEAALKARNEQNSIIEALEAENERLREAIGDIKEAWDWWNVDTYDRCASVVDDAIRAALEARHD